MIERKVCGCEFAPGHDPVNHPSHYTQNKFESIDEMMIAFGPETVYHFCICNAWKYKNRAHIKETLKRI